MILNTVNVKLQLLSAGYCLHPQFVTIRGGALKKTAFPAGFACIEHPQYGIILYDTGYAQRFFEHTKKWPFSLYAKITPVHYCNGESAVQQLVRQQIQAKDVKWIIVSHFHADHIGALSDFPLARFIYLPKAYEDVRGKNGFKALKRGFIPGLLPDDFEHRSAPIPEKSKFSFPHSFPFSHGYDIFGDRSLLAIDLSGHAEGQIGLFVKSNDQPYLLCADAAWSLKAVEENRLPHPVASLIMSDRRSYKENFQRLVQLNQQYPTIKIVPSHCNEALKTHVAFKDTIIVEKKGE